MFRHNYTYQQTIILIQNCFLDTFINLKVVNIYPSLCLPLLFTAAFVQYIFVSNVTIVLLYLWFKFMPVPFL